MVSAILQVEQLSLGISDSDVSEKWLGISDENGRFLIGFRTWGFDDFSTDFSGQRGFRTTRAARIDYNGAILHWLPSQHLRIADLGALDD